MRKGLISVLTISLLLLGGCGERKAQMEEDFAAFRRTVAEAEHIGAQAELTADYGETAQDYTLSLSGDGNRVEVEIIEPELLAGVKATAERGEAALSYDGVMLGAGALDEEGLTPVSALPVILDAMADGYVELLWTEGGYLTARLYAGEDSVCTLWLNAETLVPSAAEIASDGCTVIVCRFTDWAIS